MTRVANAVDLAAVHVDELVLLREGLGGAGLREPPPGTQRSSPREPSAPSSNPRKPPLVHALDDRRAGAVPEEDARPRSFQSVIFESVSEPTTSARSASPPAIAPYAWASA